MDQLVINAEAKGMVGILPLGYWDTIENYLPNYYTRQDVGFSNLMARLIEERDGDLEDELLSLDCFMYDEALEEKQRLDIECWKAYCKLEECR